METNALRFLLLGLLPILVECTGASAAVIVDLPHLLDVCRCSSPSARLLVLAAITCVGYESGHGSFCGWQSQEIAPDAYVIAQVSVKRDREFWGHLQPVLHDFWWGHVMPARKALAAVQLQYDEEDSRSNSLPASGGSNTDAAACLTPVSAAPAGVVSKKHAARREEIRALARVFEPSAELAGDLTEELAHWAEHMYVTAEATFYNPAL